MAPSSRMNYGWVVVAVGALMTCVGFGTMFSLAVFLQPMSETMGWSHAGISGAMTLDFLAMALAALLLGHDVRPLRHPDRGAIGAVLLGIGLDRWQAGRKRLLAIPALFGVLVGIAAGSFFAPMIAIATAWIREAAQPRGLAGLRRHGRRAGDDLAVRQLADHDL